MQPTQPPRESSDMFTRCPECHTWFRINEAHLIEAEARVRCGQCDTSFDASENLWPEADETAPRILWVPETGFRTTTHFRDDEDAEEDDVGAGPIENEAYTPPPPPPPSPAAPTKAREDISALARIDMEGDDGPVLGDVRRVRTGPEPEGPTLEPLHHAEAHPNEPTPRIHSTAATPSPVDSDLEGYYLPSRGPWIALIGALLVLALGQYAWLGAGHLADAFPALRPTLDAACAVTGCRTSGQRGSIRVVARDLAPHPEYEGALLVRAILVNRGTTAQPYPRLVFRMYAADGSLVAGRTYEPHEYLSGGLVSPEGMAPGREVPIDLAPLMPSGVAVSFDLTPI